MNGQLRWREYCWSFYCPFHKATFNRKGESTSHRAGYPPLRLHPVSISDEGTVVVDTDELIHRQAFDPKQVAPVPTPRELATAGGDNGGTRKP